MYRKDNILKKIFILILTIAIIFSFSPVAYGAASYLVQVNNVAGRSDVLIYVDGQFEKILSLGSQHTAYYPDGTGIEVVAFDYVGPDPNHVFTGWWEAYSAKTFNQSRIVFTVDKNYQWTPWYSGSTTDSAILELEVDPHGAVDVYYDSSTNPAAKDPNSPFTSAVKVHRFSLANGLDLTLHAKPDSGYTFKGWYDVDNQLISTANIHSFTVNGNEYYHAVFYNSIPVSSVSVNPPTATLEVGDLAAQDKKTVQLTATVSPSDATDKSITWTTSDNTVAKVDANGLVTAVSTGSATITATASNGKSATASITVVSKQSIPVSSVSVNPPTTTLEVGDLAAQDKKSIQLTATVFPSDATNKSITWTTSDNAIAKVDANGLVTAVSAGTATITATASNGKSASSVITVISKQSIPVSSVSVNPPTATLEVGDLAAQDKKTVQLTATVSPTDATNKSITWTSSNNTVAKVDTNGLVTAVSAGTATITATASNGKSASSAITVVSKQSIPVSSVSVNPPTATLEVGDLAAQHKKTVQLTATVSPSDATNKNIIWTTSDNAVAKVDANGLVTAVSPGVATITATSVNGKSATASITVVLKQSIPVSSVSVNPPTATLEVGDLAAQNKKTVQLTATVSPSDATNKSINWTTSDNTVVKVDANGLVTAVSHGVATITATSINGKSATASITVVLKQSIPVSSVSVNPPTAALEVGDLAAQNKKTVQLTATVSPSDATNKSITWTSSNNTVAKVDANGLVTAVSAGSATITATASNGKSDTASITVVSKQSIPVSSVSVNPPTATLEVGDLAAQDKKTIQLIATVSPSDATNKSITWTSSNNAVAKVDANGLVTAVSPEVATITATSVNGKSATASITVVSKQSIPVSSLSVNPPTATLEVGDLAA
ncbi:MAG: Ig-like domain-containing protein, partial [Clostridia bacterium]|nr:Ig-like domain-containing protein [Clostridia bacterium]